MTSEQIADASRIAPRRADVRWHDDGHLVTVERPRPGRVRRALLGVFGVPPVLRVNLDPLGSEAWRLIDGARTAADIKQALEAKFPEETGVAQRLGKFLGAMASRGLVELG